MLSSFHQSRRHGFTLIEILVAVSIVGTLATITIIALNPKKNFIESYDTLRRSDAKQVGNALYQQLIDEWEIAGGGTILEGEAQAKPICKQNELLVANGATCPNTAVNLDILTPDYIASLPIDPTIPETEPCTGYMVYLQTGRPRVVAANMGKLPGDVPAPESLCGDSIPVASASSTSFASVVSSHSSVSAASDHSAASSVSSAPVVGPCGNGTIDPGEQCDDGALNANGVFGRCRTDCSGRTLTIAATFDTDAEGWQTGTSNLGFANLASYGNPPTLQNLTFIGTYEKYDPHGPPSNSPWAPSGDPRDSGIEWDSTEGSGAGSLRFYEAEGGIYGNVAMFSASPTFTGNLSAAYGGELRFQLRNNPKLTGSSVTYPANNQSREAAVVLVGKDGGGNWLTLYHRPTIWPQANVAPFSSPVTAFTQFTVPIAVNSWRLDSLASSTLATDTQIQSVLQDVHALHILGDWWTNCCGAGINSQEFTYLDNVILTGPATP